MRWPDFRSYGPCCCCRWYAALGGPLDEGGFGKSFRTNERAEASNATPPKTTSLVCVDDAGAIGVGVDTRVLVLETEGVVCDPGLTYLFGAVL